MNELPFYQQTDLEYAYTGELGAAWAPERTVFRVWAPLAGNAALKLYESAASTAPCRVIPMSRSGGVWCAEIPGDLHGVYYTYDITTGGVPRETIDIYAKAAGTNGLRGMVTDLRRTDPEGWKNSRRVELADYTDAVIYELHVRDFSSDKSGHFSLRGKFLSFCENDVVNDFGDIVGLEYIRRLGVTHIHLLPVADFHTVDESDPGAGFNWGYDPLNYNIPEGSYSTDPADGGLRIKQFKQLVMAAHDHGLGVIMDVVYNHTFSADNSPFGKTFPGYYYRHRPDGSLSDGSGCGNEFASERAMARKFICDSLCYWAEEYKLDGFRFDLMGLLDIATLNLCADKLRRINPSIILYGEGWTGGASPLDESRRGVKRNARELPHFAMFSDDFRDGVKGSVFCDSDCGYVNGRTDSCRGELIKSVMSGGIYRGDIRRPRSETWTDRPQQAVNYVEAHDNLTLHDKLRLSMPTASAEEIQAADRFAAALVFLAQGIPFIQAGQEMLRSKPEGVGYDHNSYRSPDSVNSLKWNDITAHRDILEYYRGLIAIRKRFGQFRLRTAEEIRSRVRFEELDSGALAEHIGDLVLLMNPGETALEYPISGCAEVFADGVMASDRALYEVRTRLTAMPRSIILARLKATPNN
ncbi:MAG: type I pullulanase [Oscillospiraceae bacterium]